MHLCLTAFLLVSSLIYDKEVGGKNSQLSWVINQKNKAIEILGKAEAGLIEIICDGDFDMSKYQSNSNKNDEKLLISRQSDKLVVEKSSNKGTESQEYEIGNRNWIQDFGFGLIPFIKSQAESIKFEIINPKDLVMRTMVATKEEMDMKTFNNVEYRAQKIKITLDGYYKKFWRAELWFDTKTHNLLYYKANEGPSTPYTVITIKEIKK